MRVLKFHWHAGKNNKILLKRVGRGEGEEKKREE
jgi:hypothetical protein